MKRIDTDVLIVGGGSAGFGAAYRALRKGARVVLAENRSSLGGTSAVGGVNTWEPGVSGKGVHYRLAERILESGNGFVGETTFFCGGGRPFAVSDRSADGYESTLRRSGVAPEKQRRFHFEPDALSAVMSDLLSEVGGERLITLMNAFFVSADAENGKIKAAHFRTPRGDTAVFPKIVLDCTGSISVARAVGCGHDIGENSKKEYGEAPAPDERSKSLNGLTKCFILERTESIPPPESLRGTDASDFAKQLEAHGAVSCFNVCPRRSAAYKAGADALADMVGADARINVNMLPTIEGKALLEYAPEEFEAMLIARIYTYVDWLRENYGLSDWGISKIFPMNGVREDYRLKGKYVLTFNDELNGFPPSPMKEHIIAFADHPADTHGKDGGLRPTGVYGIPFECLLPGDSCAGNLIVACRGASFSHIAASSARLSRTMIALGEAAGNAAALSVIENIPPSEFSGEMIRSLMPTEP